MEYDAKTVAKVARERLIGLLESYKKVTSEIRNQLDVDIKRLEKIIS